MRTRKLVLKREHLTELTTENLAGIVGGLTPTCPDPYYVTYTCGCTATDTCRVSDTCTCTSTQTATATFRCTIAC